MICIMSFKGGMEMKISKRINLKRVIRIGDRNLTVLEYLRDTEYPAELISIMADENCSAMDALKILKNKNGE